MLKVNVRDEVVTDRPVIVGAMWRIRFSENKVLKLELLEISVLWIPPLKGFEILKFTLLLFEKVQF